MASITSAGCGVPPQIDGEVVASGAGWSWLLSDGRPVHLTGPAGVRGPLTVCLTVSPDNSVGARVALEVPCERWRAATPPEPVTPERRMHTLSSLAPHLGPTPGPPVAAPIAEFIASHGGRGPGLTPEGDDLLMGLIGARRALGAVGAIAECTTLERWAQESAGEPSRSLLVHASRGELVEPAHRLLDALLRGDASRAAEALPDLFAWGATSGRSLARGLCLGLAA